MVSNVLPSFPYGMEDPSSLHRNMEFSKNQITEWQMFQRFSNFRNTILSVTLPSGVELISGDLNWEGNLAANETKAVELSIRVTASGEWPIYMHAFSHDTPGSKTGYGDSQTLYVRSSTDSAEVIDDVAYRLTHRPCSPDITCGTDIPGTLIPITSTSVYP